MKRKRHLRKSIKIAIECIISALAVFAFLTILFQSVMQKSYQLTPPTAEEIANDSTLARYEK